MRLLPFFILLSVISFPGVNAQIPASSGVFFAKEFSKDISLYKAKAFVFQYVIGNTTDIVEFQLDPLAAAGSGELTSLVYKCLQKGKEGLVLGFYSDYINPTGVPYKGYSFKDLPKDKAIPLLDKIEKAIKEKTKYLDQDNDNNNVYFQSDDISFLITNKGGIKIRVFWNQFDSEWDMTAFKRTKRRLLNKLNDD
jgi:hypothetical protein